MITGSSSGTLSDGTLQTLSTSNTVGLLANLSYVHSPSRRARIRIYSYAHTSPRTSHLHRPAYLKLL